MSTLLPPSSSPLERQLERITERMTDIPLPHRDVWSPDNCPEHLLPWLAWSLGVYAWKNYWPIEIKRSVIKSAVDTKRRCGTAKSVRDVVAAFGANVAMREAHQTTPPGSPHSFEILISATAMGGQPVTGDFQQDIINEITRVKPARSYFTVSTALAASAQLGLVAAVRAIHYQRLELTDA